MCYSKTIVVFLYYTHKMQKKSADKANDENAGSDENEVASSVIETGHRVYDPSTGETSHTTGYVGIRRPIPYHGHYHHGLMHGDPDPAGRHELQIRNLQQDLRALQNDVLELREETVNAQDVANEHIVELEKQGAIQEALVEGRVMPLVNYYEAKRRLEKKDKDPPDSDQEPAAEPMKASLEELGAALINTSPYVVYVSQDPGTEVDAGGRRGSKFEARVVDFSSKRFIDEPTVMLLVRQMFMKDPASPEKEHNHVIAAYKCFDGEILVLDAKKIKVVPSGMSLIAETTNSMKKEKEKEKIGD